MIVNLHVHFLLAREESLLIDPFLLFQEESSTSHGLSCEPNPLPLSSNKNELDANYENMIENLLLQQVLLYTRERANAPHPHRSSSVTPNSLWIRQQGQQSLASKQSADDSDNEPLVLTTSRQENHRDEPSLCLIESNDDSSSHLLENILQQYNQQQDGHSNFDQNLMDLILKRNRERKSLTTCTHNGFYFRLQWLAIGLVIDRIFFYLYFTATLVSYFVTLCLIPISHPNLTIDIRSL